MGEMFIPVKTIKRHLKKISKLGVNNRHEAIAQARIRNIFKSLNLNHPPTTHRGWSHALINPVL